MNRDEILSKSRNEGLDEREQSVFLASFGFGTIVTMVLCFIFVIINFLKGQSYHEFIAIALASLSAADFYKYKKVRHSKTYMISAIFSAFVAIVSFIFFVVKG